jgi:hypothetical protein
MLCFDFDHVASTKEISLNVFCFALSDGVGQPFRWSDPHTWPWVVYVWFAFLLANGIRPLWKRYQAQLANSWPPALGQIDHAYLQEPKKLLGLTLQNDRNRTHTAVLSYSYKISGDSFQGAYRRQFGTEEEAREFLRGLEGQPVSVQYNSNNPKRSALLETTIETLLKRRPPIPESAADDSINILPAWSKPLIALCAVLSFIGLLLSLWVHVGAIFGQKVAPEYSFWMLHMGMFVVFIPAVFVAQKMVGSTRRKDFWRVATQNAPAMRYVLYFFFAYAFINFALFFFQAPSEKRVGESSPLEWRGFSGHWMLFYCSALAIHTSALSKNRISKSAAGPSTS